MVFSRGLWVFVVLIWRVFVDSSRFSVGFSCVFVVLASLLDFRGFFRGISWFCMGFRDLGGFFVGFCGFR